MPNRQSSSGGRWYPTADKLSNPRDLQAMLKQVLDQHYALVDRFEAYKISNPPQERAGSRGFPPGSGPSDTMVCGLFVQPIDARTLADGATLKFSKKDGSFKLS